MSVVKTKKPTKDGRAWQYRVSVKTLDGYKTVVSKLYATKKEAERQEAKYLIEYGKKTPTPLMTFSEVISNYLENKKSTTKPQTYDREVVLCKHIEKYLGDVSIARMTINQYESFRKELLNNDKWSVTYKNKIDKEVRSLLLFSEKKFDITNAIPFKYKPFIDNEPKKEMSILTLEQFEKFIEQETDPIYKAYFTTLMFTGMRLNEANALNWKDIDFENKKISVCKSIVAKTKSKDGLFAITTPKTQSSIRNIPIAKRLLESLKMLHSEYEQVNGFKEEWFVFGGRRPLPETSITKHKDNCLKKANLHRIRIHDFRHSFTSMLVNNLGVDNIVLISKILGHSKIEETLQTYSHLWTKSYENLVDKMNNL